MQKDLKFALKIESNVWGIWFFIIKQIEKP